MSQITFRIDGDPVAQGRPRFVVRGKFATVYDPKKSKDYKKDVAKQSMVAVSDNEWEISHMPLFLNIEVIIQRPKSLPKKVRHCIKKPDIDNYAKGIMDAMQGVLYHDDSQINYLQAKKRYTEPGESAGVIVEIREMKG